jgi:hypothetical protein
LRIRENQIHSPDTTMINESLGILFSVFLPFPIPAQFAPSGAVASIARRIRVQR